jgi:broad specificity phosphatase PhoE
MAELYFLRHGQRIDHVINKEDKGIEAIFKDYKEYDPSLASSAIEQLETVGKEILGQTQVFDDTESGSVRKNVFIHFSPYLRCCQTADLLVSDLKARFEEKYPNYKVRFQLLGDFALSEWVHERMKNKPPFTDSNDAYHMYTPNIKLLKNRSCVSNFRPTNTLGPYNGPNLSYKDYQANCKEYFLKLVATYNRQVHLKNQDIIIVISHGYAINNFLSYFINHPIFDEIPEASLNFARRVLVNEDHEIQDPLDLDQYKWKLFKDSLNILEKEDIDSTLNLETDIVYYKTNFFKKDDFDESNNLKLPTVPAQDQPRASFRMSTTGSTKDPNRPEVIRNYNPICSAAKDWSPQMAKQFAVKSAFKLKRMNDDSFKKTFNLQHHPSKPISPEVSPNSEPTRNNSVIDLTKLVDNEDINKPMRLKYSTTSEIPIHRLNSKINSQVNLAQYQRDNASSNDNSTTDLPRFLSSLQNKPRKRSTSNPILATVAHNAKDSYFPLTVIGKASHRQSNDLLASIDSGSPVDDYGSCSDLDIIEEHNVRPIQGPQQPENPLLSRSKSLNYKRTISDKGSTSLLAKYKQHQLNNESDDSDSQKAFALPYSLNRNNQYQKATSTPPQRRTPPSPVANNSPKTRNSIRFIPSVFNSDGMNGPVNGTSIPTGFSVSNSKDASKKPMFYHLNSDDGSNSDSGDSSSDIDDYNGDGDEDDKMDVDKEKQKSKKKKDQYIWFGQNRR